MRPHALNYAITFVAGLCAGALIDRWWNQPEGAPARNRCASQTTSPSGAIRITCARSKGHDLPHYNGSYEWVTGEHGESLPC